MGLSECQGILRRHGGKIEVESVPSEGTLIRVTLPISATNTANPVNAADPGNDAIDTNSTVADVEPSMASAKVLYIDDDETVRKSSEALLKSFGIDVETADDGPSGVRRIEQTDFQLVICDQGMPDMDGVEVLRKIKELRPELPVALVSGWSLPAIDGSVQPDEFLEKPVSYEDMLNVLQRYLPIKVA